MQIEVPECDWISLSHKFKRGALWMCGACGKTPAMHGKTYPFEGAEGMRWSVDILYRTETGDNLVEHFVEELEEIQNIVERGPDWNTIINISIDLIRVHSPGLTVERSADI